MLKNPSDALRRADKIVASAFCLTLAMAGAAVAYAPYTEQSAPAAIKVAAASAITQTVLPAQPVNVAKNDPATLQLHATPAAFQVGGQTAQSSLTPAQEELLAQVFLQQGNCLADAMYYEARGEGRSGQMAIAEVVYNRMRSGYYPNTVCGVVYEGAKLHTGCQFSFTCSGDMDRPRSAAVWRSTQRLALQIVLGLVKLGDTTGGALSFHAQDVQPDWADTMLRTTQIGHHIFYRPVHHAFTRAA